MAATYVIGIDIGTGSTKAVALDSKARVMATAQSAYTTALAANGHAEQPPDAIWPAFVQCLNTVVEQVGRAPAAVGISSCMHSLMAVDDRGAPLTGLLTWEDRRSAPIAHTLRQQRGAEALQQATGLPLHAMSPLCRVAWFAQNEKETFAKAARWISVKEWLWFRLFGIWEVDVSVAAASGLLNRQTLDWHDEALRWAGIGRQQLSTIQPVDHRRSGLVADASAQLQLPAHTPFYIGSSDGCLASLGSGAAGPGVGAVTIGTSGAVRVATAAPVPGYHLFSYPLHPGLYISGGAVNNGGNTVLWALQSGLGGAAGQKDFEAFYQKAAAVPPGSQGLLFLPYLHGERAPLWDEWASGAFIGIRPQHSEAHFCRAVLEGVCFALNDVLLQVEAATAPVPQLRVSGGVTRSAVWLLMLADITGKPLGVGAEADASATGAALLALQGQGIAAEPPPPRQWVQPQVHPAYQSSFAIFRSLYAPLKEAMHGLYPLQNA